MLQYSSRGKNKCTQSFDVMLTLDVEILAPVAKERRARGSLLVTSNVRL